MSTGMNPIKIEKILASNLDPNLKAQFLNMLGHTFAKGNNQEVADLYFSASQKVFEDNETDEINPTEIDNVNRE